ncbi:MAG: hypothetical protein R2939_20885 [Kofleriaceae bacterium]
MVRLAALAQIAARSPRPGAELIDHVARSPEDELTRHEAARAPARIARARPPSTRPVTRSGIWRWRAGCSARAALAQRWTDALDELDVVALAARVRGWEDRTGRWLAPVRAAPACDGARGELPDDDGELARDLELAAEARRSPPPRRRSRRAPLVWRPGAAARGRRDHRRRRRRHRAPGRGGDSAASPVSAFADLSLDGDFERGWRALIAEATGEHAALDGDADGDGPAVFAASAEARPRSLGIAAARLATAAGVDALALADERRGHLLAAGGGRGLARAGAGPARLGPASPAARVAAEAAGVGDVVAACDRGRVALGLAADADAWERATPGLGRSSDRAGAGDGRLRGPDLHDRVAELSERERGRQAVPGSLARAARRAQSAAGASG